MRTLNNQELSQGKTLEQRARQFASSAAYLGKITSIAVGGSIGLIMVADTESNPLEAMEAVVDGYKIAFDKNMCSAGPNAEEKAKLQSVIDGQAQPIHLAIEAAREQGLTFGDVNETLERVIASPNAATATQEMSHFTENNYGFKLSLRMPELVFDDAATDNYKRDLNTFGLIISTLPTELIKGIPLDSVEIGPVFHESDGAIIGTYAYKDRDMTIDINHIDEPATFIHEAFGHAAHSESCSGYQPRRDDAFIELNPDHHQYSDDPHTTNYNVVASTYGNTSMPEDYAEVMEGYFVDTLNADAVNSPDAPLRKKLELGLHRLDAIAPGSTTYLAHTKALFRALYDANAADDYPYDLTAV